MAEKSSRAEKAGLMGRIIRGKRRLGERRDPKAAGEAPVVVSYLTLAMKLNPNLERAASLASEHFEGCMGREIRDVLSKVHLRVYPGVGEALSKFAQRWERFCPELKQSIHLIRNSENDHGVTRERSLDRALKLILDGSRERMRDFASSLHMPTLLIYSMGVLLPLVLVATLPVLSVMNVGLGLVHIFAIYCLFLPILIHALIKRVLSMRPSNFRSPKDLSGRTEFKRFLLSAILLFLTPLLPFCLGASEDVVALATLWGLTLCITIYLYPSTAAFRLRKQTIQMENEFYDAILRLANLLGEGHPPEDALQRVADSMKGSELEKVFRKASTNIRLGMGLRAALFDEGEGALRSVHSRMIRDSMKMFVDLIERGTRAAGEAILKVGDHLRELREAELEIRRSMREIVTSMRSVALFFAPLVASIAARIHGALASKIPSSGLFGSVGISPPAFLFLLGFYTIILTSILMSFAVGIELGDDKLARRMAIASALPVALGVFTAGATVGGRMLEAMIG